MSVDIELFEGQNRLEQYRLDVIQYKGVVDFDKLYNRMISWFRDRKYDFYETLYKDKPPELEIEWSANRKVDDFYKYQIDVSFHLFEIEKVEAVKNGETKQMISTRMWIRFEPTLIADWQDRWGENKFTEILLKFYLGYVAKRDLQLQYADPLWYITYQLHNIVKEELGMTTAGGSYV